MYIVLAPLSSKALVFMKRYVWQLGEISIVKVMSQLLKERMRALPGIELEV